MKTGAGRVFRRRNRQAAELPTWWIEYYDATGRQCRESANTTDHREALNLLRTRLGDVAKGTVRPVAVERVTVNDLLDLLQRDYADRSKSVPPGQLEAWRARLGHMRARDVDRCLIEDVVRDWRTKGPEWPGRPSENVRPLGNASSNRYIGILHQAYRIGRAKIRHFDYNPSFPHFKEKARGRYITPSDFGAILAALADDCLRDYFTVAYCCGTRRTQLMRTELANVDCESWVISWRPDQTKNGEPHSVPLEGDALAAVQRRWAARNLAIPYLFHRRGKRLTEEMVRRAWKKACVTVNLPEGRGQGYVFHDTRHSCVTNLSAAGVPDSVAMQVTGHRSANVFRRYGVQIEDVKRDALRRAHEYRESLGTRRKVISLSQGASKDNNKDNKAVAAS
jgi:integrase